MLHLINLFLHVQKVTLQYVILETYTSKSKKLVQNVMKDKNLKNLQIDSVQKI